MKHWEMNKRIYLLLNEHGRDLLEHGVHRLEKNNIAVRFNEIGPRRRDGVGNIWINLDEFIGNITSKSRENRKHTERNLTFNNLFDIQSQ